MHPVTLRFAPDLEREFQSEYHVQTLAVVRLAMVLGILLYSVFGVLDTLIAPAQRHELWFIRFAVVVPVLLTTLVLTYAPWFQRIREPVLFLAVLTASL